MAGKNWPESLTAAPRSLQQTALLVPDARTALLCFGLTLSAVALCTFLSAATGGGWPDLPQWGAGIVTRIEAAALLLFFFSLG
jgi:hypothetical protein